MCGVGLGFSQVTLYLLRQLEHLAWGLVGQAADGRIEELVFRLEAPGLRLDERRLSHHPAHPFVYETDGLSQLLFPVAQIATQAQIHLMHLVIRS